MPRILSLLRNNALGLVAIVIATSAGAYAVDQAPKDSVVSSSIKNGQVRSVDVKADSLTGEDINESTLSLPAGAGGTVTSVSAGAGLEGGTITKSGTVRLATCPTGQLLKSNGAGYSCAADDDTDSDTTYDAGTGLQLDGSTFSVADGGIGSAQVADGALVAADLGRAVQDLNLPGAGLTLANSTCNPTSVFVTDGPGEVGDFVLASTVPAIPPSWVVTARVGPGVAGTAFRQYFVSVCNFAGASIAIPTATLKMLVISQ